MTALHPDSMVMKHTKICVLQHRMNDFFWHLDVMRICLESLWTRFFLT